MYLCSANHHPSPLRNVCRTAAIQCILSHGSPCTSHVQQGQPPLDNLCRPQTTAGPIVQGMQPHMHDIWMTGSLVTSNTHAMLLRSWH